MAILAENAIGFRALRCQPLKERRNVFGALEASALNNVVHLDVLAEKVAPALGALESPLGSMRTCFRDA